MKTSDVPDTPDDASWQTLDSVIERLLTRIEKSITEIEKALEE